MRIERNARKKRAEAERQRQQQQQPQQWRELQTAHCVEGGKGGAREGGVSRLPEKPFG